MSKSINKIKKNITKNKEKEKEEYPTKNKILNFVNIIFGIIVLVVLAIIIALYSDDKYNFKDVETKISYEEIMAGQTFNRPDDTYYVVFYEPNNETESKLNNAITTVAGRNIIYKVNLKDNMNKSVVSNKSNKKATKAEELKIKGTTLIKIEKGKNVKYIEGLTAIINYLNSL